MMTKQQVLDKVEKLLALGGNAGATEGERENAMRMAQNLLAKHNLAEAELDKKGTGTETRLHEIKEFQSSPWRRNLANSAARLSLCYYAYFKGTRRHIFVGKETNVQAAMQLTDYLMKTLAREASAYGRANGGSRSRTSFLNAAVETVGYRVGTILAETAGLKSATPGTGLVLANVYQTELQANRQYADSLWGRGKTGRRGKVSMADRDAVAAGREAGSRIRLRKEIH